MNTMLSQIQQLQQQVREQHQQTEWLFDHWLIAAASAENAPVGTAESDRRWQVADEAMETHQAASEVLNELTDQLDYVIQTAIQNRPYYITNEMYDRLLGIFDSHPQDLDYVADVVYREYPELDKRTAGLAAVWGSKNLVAVAQ